MKKILASLVFVFAGIYSFGQIDQIYVEKFTPTPTAIAADADLTGATTYRIFADLSAGWNLHGVTGAPSNPIYFDLGAGTIYNSAAGGINPLNGPFALPTVDSPDFYDSWFTMGGIGAGPTASRIVPTSEDTDGTLDGFILGAGNTVVAPSWASSSSDPNDYFGYGVVGPSIPETADGTGGTWDAEVESWFNTAPVTGSTVSNSTCIAQITTTGSLTLELGLLISNEPSAPYTIYRYVYRAVVGTDVVIDPALFYTSLETNNAPTATISSPVDGANVPFNTDLDVEVDVDPNNSDVALTEIASVTVRVGGAGGAEYTETLPGGTHASDGPFTVTVPAAEIIEGSISLEANAEKVADNLEGTYSTPISVTGVRDLVAPTAALSISPAQDLEGNDFTFDVTGIDWGSGLVVGDYSIEYYADGNLVHTSDGFVSAPASDSYIWTSAGTGIMPVEIILDNGDLTTTLTGQIIVLNAGDVYQILSREEDCSVGDRFCIEIAKLDTVEDVTGFEFSMSFEADKVQPTGQLTVLPNGPVNDYNTDFYIYVPEGQTGAIQTMNVSVFLAGEAQGVGGGEVLDVEWDVAANVPLFCVEFAKTSNFAPVDQVTFDASNIIESHLVGVELPVEAAEGTYSTTTNTVYNGFAKFWYDYSGNYAQPTAPVLVQTRVDDGSGNGLVYTQAPEGGFSYDFGATSSTQIRIRKNMVGTPLSRLPDVFSGYDALLVAKVITNDPSFQPGPYQMIAMDVNADGLLSAGDVSQINQRSVGAIEEFVQDAGAVPAQLDWVFVNEDQASSDPSWVKSPNFPESSGPSEGYGKSVIPDHGNNRFELDGEQILNMSTCPVIIDNNNTYVGVALGDVDGSWRTASYDDQLKSAEATNQAIVFDLNNAYIEEEYVNIPVKVVSEQAVNAINVVVGYSAGLQFESVLSHADYLQPVTNTDGVYAAVVAQSLTDFQLDQHLLTFRFYAPAGFSSADITELHGWLDGKRVNVLNTVTGVEPTAINVNVYPNPATDLLKVRVSENVMLQMIDLNGRTLYQKFDVNGTEEIDISSMARGVYILKISSERNTAMKRIVLE